MSGIFGVISNMKVNVDYVNKLATHSKQRGKDSSGIVSLNSHEYEIIRADYEIMKLLKKSKWQNSQIVIGQSGSISYGIQDNQPIVRDGIFAINCGIIVNEKDIWNLINQGRKFQSNSEVITALALEHIQNGGVIEELPNYILSKCKGVVSSALFLPKLGKLLLFSNNGSLYAGKKNDVLFFATESYPLKQIECKEIRQIKEKGLIVDIPVRDKVNVTDYIYRNRKQSITNFNYISTEEKILQFPTPKLKRCTRCILPETMPFITFDEEGVCNYCHNYKPVVSRPKEELFKLVEPYRRQNGPDCIVPFSGGRDSCYSLHLIVKELKMTPITYTYDWGMVTDLGHRNISRMCSELGVENIVVAADVTKKRENITKNLKAWLKSPHLGMISILTAGDKHFFQHVETIKKQTGIDLNLWGINPLEVTHFKSGFLGIKPDFEEKKVYTSRFSKQFRYQYLRFKAMCKSPSYFNSSIIDTLSGEYYRSFAKKSDYFHVFDYWPWDEKVVDSTLEEYDWELAPDTNTTWRIGDGTAAFYNYIYYMVAGFTEHDTFRSNQIREGQITREEAMELVKDENRPRYQNIRWYLDLLGMDFVEVIKVINSIPKLYSMEK